MRGMGWVAAVLLLGCGSAQERPLQVSDLQDEALVWVRLMGFGGEPVCLTVDIELGDVPEGPNRTPDGRCWRLDAAATVDGVAMEVQRTGGTTEDEFGNTVCHRASFALPLEEHPGLGGDSTDVRIRDESSEIRVVTEGLFEPPRVVVPDGELIAGEANTVDFLPTTAGLFPELSIHFSGDVDHFGAALDVRDGTNDGNVAVGSDWVRFDVPNVVPQGGVLRVYPERQAWGVHVAECEGAGACMATRSASVVPHCSALRYAFVSDRGFDDIVSAPAEVVTAGN